MKGKLTLLFLSIILFASCISAQTTKFAVISDIHYLSSELAKEGDALLRYEESTGRNVAVLHEVFEKALYEINKENPDVLLITGDMTNHGEKQSHIDFIDKLKIIKESGTRIFVVPGNHDINVPNTRKYIGDSPSQTSNVSEKEFENLYWEYGYSEALQRDVNSLSYLSKIDNNTWLIAFDTNMHREYKTNSISAGRISSETMSWAMDILNSAREKNVTVMGMMHHGLVEHLPYQSTFFSDYLIDDWEQRAKQLSDAGMKVMFTGHFHANDITLFTSDLGNNIYDVETGSLAQYSFPYRIMEWDNEVLSIKTFNISSVSSVTNLQEVYRNKHEEMLRSTISAKLNNIGIPMSNDVKGALIDLLVRMSVLHASGDEKMDLSTAMLVDMLGKVLGGDSFDSSNFSFDYPPADNNIKIKLR